MITANICKICNTRKARRPCPAVHGDICAICCGTERETTLTCPLECEFLQQAHRHEDPIEVPPEQIANQDVTVTERFVGEHEELLLFCVYALVQAAIRTAGSIDADVMAALEALIQTQRTLQAGLVYDTYSENSIAASIQRSFSASLADYSKLRQEREALSPLRNEDVLKTLVFLHRVGQQNQNGRPKSRMFLDLLRHMTPDVPADERAPSIIV